MCDAKLVAKMLGGDIYAANKLINKHKKDLLGFCTTKLLDNGLAEDCYQLTWEKAFKKLHTYRDIYSFKAWLFKICQNTIYDEIRRKNAKMRGKTAEEKYKLDLEYYETLLARQKTTEQLALDKELRAELLKAVFNLPNKFKDIVTLRFFHGKTFSEISELTELNESTVKYRLKKAMDIMKNELGDDWYV